MKCRVQCKACPWRKDVVPGRDIPGGYCVKKHERLQETVASQDVNAQVAALGQPLRLMACHESPGEEGSRRSFVCVGWLHNQLGIGNNLALRHQRSVTAGGVQARGRAAPDPRRHPSQGEEAVNWSFQQFQPPGARGKYNVKQMTDAGWFAEEKLDGDRRIAQFCPEAVRFTGRVVSKIDGLMVEKTDNVPHISGKTLHNIVPAELLALARKAAAGLEGTVLDGEMVCAWKGARSRDVTSIMGSLPAEAVRKQNERGWVTYMVFDCLFYKGVDIRSKPQAERRLIAAGVVEKWGNPNVKMVEAAIDGREAFLNGIWDRQGEGIILKRIDGKYGDEKAWVKVKREVTHDVVIMGFDPPKDVSVKSTGELSVTKYAAEGLIGAIRFGQYKEVSLDDFHKTRLADPFCAAIAALVEGDKRYLLTYCGSTSGFDDDIRRAISKDPRSFIGAVMEITAQLREESGKFRHPRFGMMRNNKTANMCKWGVT